MTSIKYRYSEMSWPECKAAADADKVAVLPVATYEDHGYHLPIDADVVLCTEISERAVAALKEEAVLIPAVSHGYSPHHMDFPGTITISWDTFINYVKDVCLSLAHHGFKRILIVNGHGSNSSPLDLAARLSILESKNDILCAQVNHWGVRQAREAGEHLRTSAYGGIAHAGEYETSLYLALKPDLVAMDKATNEASPLPVGFQADLISGKARDSYHANLMPYWSSLTESGVLGDAKEATQEKGEKWLQAAVEGLVELIREFRAVPIRARQDHH